jgi:rare lipoprotein A
MASFSADEQHGRPTASGERYDMRQLVAAHPTLPFGTRVRVTRVETGQSVVVRIIDRGPFVKGRIIDLSFEAAKRLDFLDQGTAPVTISVAESPD